MDFLEVLHKVSQHSLGVLGDHLIPKKYALLDLSESNKSLLKVDVSCSLKFGNFVDHYLQQHEANVAFGGYLEQRSLYRRSIHFNNPSELERNIHLGVDLWSPVDTPIYAPLEGVIHSFKNNIHFGDYGPTIILKHEYLGVAFYTLYGHLSLSSLEDKQVGQYIEKGAVIGALGDASVNGDYPPHLHFQVIKDIQNYYGDYPGVCSRLELSFYRTNCPNPFSMLKIDY
ncbi:peptidoglycan DD-metalloendopeptidase family protein [Tamlana haliotis]|uniref:Peptidoglycan DD-metalloendopeptidase family protein n=1 Tax=Pseudotamlana haliotis TaxID=2614804 RepID=A0A6N6MIV1_9FLAO|nr:peptidoglycan DD-metalloendopeptidase family protein [Tamlana haliotis]KAB1069444.1 peptidoglycan DD-metalloendopeptidase family protein [Tamlana haliotis]